MNGTNREATLSKAMEQIHNRLDERLESSDPRDAVAENEIRRGLICFATCLERWCRVASFAPVESELTLRGAKLYDPLDLLKDIRARIAFQMRILANESRTLHGHNDYFARVRALLASLDET